MDESSKNPLDAVAETVGEQTAEAFGLLGNKTRLAILLALWDAIDPTTPMEGTDTELSFSEIRDRIGMEDPGQFNYHLDKLVGEFVEQTADGYTLTAAAERILSVVIAGALADDASFTDEPIDANCWLCGASVVMDYSDRKISLRCTSCEGEFAFTWPDDPSGLLLRRYQPPAGLTNRTPQEFHRRGNVMSRHNLMSVMEGVCPNCTGTVTATASICENHEPTDDALCPHCHRKPKIGWNYVCSICKNQSAPTAWAPIFTEMGVLSFCYEHGVDIYDIYDTDSWGIINDAVDTTVKSRDPLEIGVTLELDGDRLDVTLDEDARVIDFAETTG